jgi:hypothetical protein
MKSMRFSGTILCSLLGGAALCVALSLPLGAQVQSTSTESQGSPTKSVTIQRGEIVAVNGNSVVLKMEDGTLEEFDNLPENLTFMVDGRPVNYVNAKVGMKLEKQTVKTTVPKVVTTVETVTGTVFHTQIPNIVILKLENGENQQFKVPEGQKFMVNGQEKGFSALRKGMNVTVQRVTEVPLTFVTEEIKRTGSVPPPPAAPKPDLPIVIVQSQPEPTPAVEPAKTKAQPEALSATLPKTASDMPLIGLLGALLCATALALRAARIVMKRNPSH